MVLRDFLNFLFIPFSCFGCFSVQPNQVVIVEAFGKPIKIVKDEGLHCHATCCFTFRNVSKALETINLKGSSVPDKSGSPLNISVVITYTIDNPMALTYNVEKEKEFLMSQALEVVRRVVSNFNYRSNDPNETTLLKDTMVIGTFMKQLVNVKLKLAGIHVTRMEMMEISYHPEIAQGMLQIQQAQAKVEARKEIVKGGVQIVNDAIV